MELVAAKSAGWWPANRGQSMRTFENKRAQALRAHDIASGRARYAASREACLLGFTVAMDVDHPSDFPCGSHPPRCKLYPPNSQTKDL